MRSWPNFSFYSTKVKKGGVGRLGMFDSQPSKDQGRGLKLVKQNCTDCCFFSQMVTVITQHADKFRFFFKLNQVYYGLLRSHFVSAKNDLLLMERSNRGSTHVCMITYLLLCEIHT